MAHNASRASYSRASRIIAAGAPSAADECVRERSLAGQIRHYVAVEDIRITTAHDSDEEQRVAQLLADLLERYDTTRWHFTLDVVIDETAIPHSHPVLTLTTRVMGRSLVGLITAFLHEQLHWYLEANEDAGFAAIAEVQELFPEVPTSDDGGARDAFSTLLHLLLNWLELESLRQVVGEGEADELLRGAGGGRVYVFDRYEDIASVIRRHGLDKVLTPT